MRRQGSRSSSREKAEAIFQEEKEVSEAFQIRHFYDHSQQLNIQELKQRLQAFKQARKKDLPQPSRLPISPIQTLPKTSPKDRSPKQLGTKQEELAVQRSRVGYSKPQLGSGKVKELEKSRMRGGRRVNYVTISGNRSEQFSSREGVSKADISSHWQSRQSPLGKSKTHYRTNLPKAAVATALQHLNFSQKRRSKTQERQLGSKCSTSRQSLEQAGCLQGKVRLTSPEQIAEVENWIQNLWAHYQLVTRILVGLRDGPARQKNSIVNYINTVCSNRFEFLRELIDNLSRSANKQEIHLAKRLSRAVVLSRILQSIGILYVGLYLCLEVRPDSHLVNCVGYSTSSLAFNVRMVSVVHDSTDLQWGRTVEGILTTIGEFERSTYGGKISKVSEVTLRLEQNNEVALIVQQKLCSRMPGAFQQTLSTLLRHADLDKPLYEYGHYLFQFLAFHLCSLGVQNRFPALQTPPLPYLTALPKNRTLVIEPWGVLFARKDGVTYLRAHTELFLHEVVKHWNLVYWSDLMPKDIDDLLSRLPNGRWLYRYHCLQINGVLLKPLERIGCNTNQTLIIDRAEGAFRKYREMGIALPWRAKRRDIRLLELLDLLQPLFHDDRPPFCQQIASVRGQLFGTIRRRVVSKPSDEEEMYPSPIPVPSQQ